MRRFCYAAAVVGLAGVLSTGTTSAWGAALDPGDLPEPTRVYLHVDVEMLLDSQLGQAILERRGWEETERNVERTEGWLGFNPYEDLRQVLVFSTNFEPEEGVIVLYGDFDEASIVERMGEAREYETLEIEGREAHRVTMGRNDEERSFFVSFVEAGAALASSQQRLREALPVIEGDAEGLGEDATIVAPQREGAIMQMGAVELGELPHHSQITESLEAMRFVFGEEDGEAFSQARVRAVDEETAEQVVDMVEGIRAFALLRQGEDSPQGQLMQAVEIDRDAAEVDLNWRYELDELMPMLEELMKDNDWRHMGR